MVSVALGRPADRRCFEVARTVDAPADRVWTLLTDTDRWPDWGPSVRAVASEDRVVRAGTTGRVATALGPSLPFVVTTCTDRRWTWRVAGVRATGHRVEPPADGDPDRCRAVFEVPLWAPIYVPVCVLALRRLARLATAPGGGAGPA